MTQPPRPTRVAAATGGDRQSDAQELTERVAQVAGGAARAAVLGVSDGLVTNVALILGVAGANASAASVRLAGFASLIAGALSMAAGEWISMRSQVEIYRGVLAEINQLVQRNPRLVLDELTDRLEAAGFGRTTAQLASTELPLDEPRFQRFTARTVFGLDPDQLGSPLAAAGSSLLLFAVGALVPLLPWFWLADGLATAVSVAATAVASAIVGAYVSRSGGRGSAVGALRQVVVVAAAAAVTYGIGTAFGSVIS
ncbi:MAG TPA: VIT1/CCC1 transporter family protein [Mycobacteriales bacterium]|nr:VIT1/CCC1 transporter family protein [Mycobacteriales bacterium]